MTGMPFLVLVHPMSAPYFRVVACHIYEKSPRCFRTGKSNLKTVLESLLRTLQENVCCPKLFFGYENVFEVC